MDQQPNLTEAEWGLIVELLEREQSELPPEIHHTRTNSVREELRQRLKMVRSVLGQLRTAVHA